MPLESGQVLENRYRVVRLLGQGGFGAVYRAWDLRLELPVAIKENLDGSEGAQRQFGREAKMLARLSHPNLARVSDFFFIPGQGQYLVMDYVEGESLDAKLRQQGALLNEQVVAWVVQVCDALEYLHGQNPAIIHRDIKPANIIVRPDGRAVLVDFGIAKVYDTYLSTTIGAKAVTPGYSPPEQYGGGKTDERSDIYAVGATLYHLLTGKMPDESVQLVASGARLEAPRRLNGNIRVEVESAIIRCTELETSQRFQNIGELIRALEGGKSGSSAMVPPTHTITSLEATLDLRAALQESRPLSKGGVSIRAPEVFSGLGIGGVVAVLAFSLIGTFLGMELLDPFLDVEMYPATAIFFVLGAGAGAYGRIVGRLINLNAGIANIFCPLIGMLMYYVIGKSESMRADEREALVIFGFGLVLAVPFLIKVIVGGVRLVGKRA